MSTRRRFTEEFKDRIALEALRGDETVPEIAAKHKGASEPGRHVEAAGDRGSGRGVLQRSGARASGS
jgi:transposase-like protein